MSRWSRRIAVAASLALASLIVTAGAALADGPWPNDPQGPQAREIAGLYWIMFALAVIVLAIVLGALVYSGIRFRERPGHSALQMHGHNVLELTWTVIPTIMVLSLSVLSFQRLNFVNDTRSDVGMTVKVEGRQWTWSYTYPDEPRFRLSDGSTLVAGQELHIPVGMKVRLELSSKDVIHSFFVPGLGGKKDAVPGHETDMWIQADRPGSYKGQCTEFCGDGHADMLVLVVAHDQGDYDAWAKGAVTAANLINDPATKAGRELFLALACSGCHTIAGTTAQGKVGPELTHIASKDSIAGVLRPVSEENLKKWISNPPGVKPGTQMPNLGLPPDNIDAIVKFLLTLK
ncbi:MAG: cytochrome c oxidase subunit II [Chloroflexota bacterium]|nr:cytochrome c oxidase subunit II [Chloroflexota bacterium]